ncbi:MAG: glycosylasparaginase [Acidobacteria bacterium]|nr:glycosylasparaginase [Acidobacteriota bacterium]
MTRRSLLAGAPLAAAAGAAQAQSGPRNMAISSSNGMVCCNRVLQMLNAGHDTLDAVVAGVNMVEVDPEDTSVGYGGLPNEDGVVELDSCLMHGPTRRAGAVGALRGIKTPSKVAKLVLERTDHVMLVGEGALRFAKAHGFQEEELLTERARLAWLTWKESLGTDWGPGLDAPPDQGNARLRELFPDARPEWFAWAREVATNPPTGTINCLALNAKGEMSGCTTTSGLAWKIPGRVGDSPIIGAGCFVDQEVGAAGSTGRGEENIRICGAHTIVENMRHGMSAEEAVLDAIRRVARNYDNDRARLEKFDLFFYALRKDGQHAAATLWDRSANSPKRRQYVVNDGSGSQLADASYLLERG